MVVKQGIYGARILVVDDQAVNIELLRQVLAATGYTNVSSTQDPRAVCDLHAQHHYDVILLDLQMPGMDGFQVMEALKAGQPDDYLPVIVLTAQPGHRVRALQAGAKDFISKPFDLAEVKTRLYNMLEVRLLYRAIEAQNRLLEQTVLERTAQLRDSEARFKALADLASDWYWEQDDAGNFTKVSGPVLEMLGAPIDASDEDRRDLSGGSNERERSALRQKIAARQPFLDFVFTRMQLDGSEQKFRVSGEPMFDRTSRFIGYRGIGIELLDER